MFPTWGLSVSDWGWILDVVLVRLFVRVFFKFLLTLYDVVRRCTLKAIFFLVSCNHVARTPNDYFPVPLTLYDVVISF